MAIETMDELLALPIGTEVTVKASERDPGLTWRRHGTGMQSAEGVVIGAEFFSGALSAGLMVSGAETFYPTGRLMHRPGTRYAYWIRGHSMRGDVRYYKITRFTVTTGDTLPTTWVESENYHEQFAGYPHTDGDQRPQWLLMFETLEPRLIKAEEEVKALRATTEEALVARDRARHERDVALANMEAMTVNHDRDLAKARTLDEGSIVLTKKQVTNLQDLAGSSEENGLEDFLDAVGATPTAEVTVHVSVTGTSRMTRDQAAATVGLPSAAWIGDVPDLEWSEDIDVKKQVAWGRCGCDLITRADVEAVLPLDRGALVEWTHVVNDCNSDDCDNG